VPATLPHHLRSDCLHAPPPLGSPLAKPPPAPARAQPPQPTARNIIIDAQPAFAKHPLTAPADADARSVQLRCSDISCVILPETRCQIMTLCDAQRAQADQLTEAFALTHHAVACDCKPCHRPRSQRRNISPAAASPTMRSDLACGKDERHSAASAAPRTLSQASSSPIRTPFTRRRQDRQTDPIPLIKPA
jgi:hypothetical protein